MKIKIRLTNEEEAALESILENYLENEHVQSMRTFIQHGKVTTYDHCYMVARCSFWLNRKLRMGASFTTLAVGAMLHDFYLYDWHNSDGGSHRLHGFSHPKTASKNARRIFDITDKQSHVIESHMWPLTLTKIPRSREAILVSLADKYCALCETFFGRK